jgi:hypothetical protein
MPIAGLPMLSGAAFCRRLHCLVIHRAASLIKKMKARDYDFLCYYRFAMKFRRKILRVISISELKGVVSISGRLPDGRRAGFRSWSAQAGRMALLPPHRRRMRPSFNEPPMKFRGSLLAGLQI